MMNWQKLLYLHRIRTYSACLEEDARNESPSCKSYCKDVLIVSQVKLFKYSFLAFLALIECLPLFQVQLWASHSFEQSFIFLLFLLSAVRISIAFKLINTSLFAGPNHPMFGWPFFSVQFHSSYTSSLPSTKYGLFMRLLLNRTQRTERWRIQVKWDRGNQN
jgi:hypothetical protein